MNIVRSPLRMTRRSLEEESFDPFVRRSWLECSRLLQIPVLETFFSVCKLEPEMILNDL